MLITVILLGISLGALISLCLISKSKNPEDGKD